MTQKFLLFLDKPPDKKYSKFCFELIHRDYNKIHLDGFSKITLFFNTPISEVVELVLEYELGLYIILPFEQLITNNKLMEAKSFQKGDSMETIFTYLDALIGKKTLEEADKAFIDSFKHQFDYDADELLDKINAKGKVENLNTLEKYCLEKISKNDRK